VGCDRKKHEFRKDGGSQQIRSRIELGRMSACTLDRISSRIIRHRIDQPSSLDRGKRRVDLGDGRSSSPECERATKLDSGEMVLNEG
jgi:hypothetical protein